MRWYTIAGGGLFTDMRTGKILQIYNPRGVYI